MKKRIEAIAVYVLAFAVPAAVMLWAYASVGMAPWGDKTILISDMASQYVDFFCALKHGNLFFSWSKALGTGYIGVVSYYVSSPLSLLTLLCPNEYMPIGLMLLTVLKIGLAGLSFALFARRRFPGCGWAAAAGAVCYALMSYNVAYSLCIMWLDGVIWLPLILLALERVLAGKGAGPFIAALTVCFVSTWYISYMIGVFCCLYLLARLVALRPERKALGWIAGRFLGGAACALALTAWLWLPTFLAMFNGKFGGGNVDYAGLLACEPLDLLDQFQARQYVSLGYGSLPYVFCGTAVLLLAVAYFGFRRFPAREQLANAGVLAVLVASMLLSPLDKAWHLFQRPNWFSFRYSFVVSFFLIYLAVQALAALPDQFRGRGRQLAGAAAAVLSLLTVVELGWNSLNILSSLDGFYSYKSNAQYYEEYTANAELVSVAQVDGGDGFYRMGAELGAGEYQRLNSPLAFGYAGITHYSSLYNSEVNSLLKSLGLAQSWYWCASFGSTPVTDAVLDIRYVISQEELPGYEPVARSESYTLWKNPDVLPLAVLARGDTLTAAGRTVFERQNDLLSGLTGERTAAFTPVSAEVTEGEGWAELVFTGTGLPVYADLSNLRYQQVAVNGEPILKLGPNEAASVHYLGTPGAGIPCTVTVVFRSGQAPDAGSFLWEYHADALSEAVRMLDDTEILSVEKNGRVRLSVRADRPRTLVTTIPAEDGWTAYVDGKKTDTGRYLDTFLSLELTEGTHRVELRYTAPGLIPGMALGGLALLGLVLVIVWKRKRNA